MKKPSLTFLGFLQASGLVVYLILLTLFFTFVGPILDTGKPAADFYIPIVMLLIFVMSAVISATLILGKACMLFWEKNYKKAFKLLAHTILWILFYLGLFVLLIFKG